VAPEVRFRAKFPMITLFHSLGEGRGEGGGSSPMTRMTCWQLSTVHWQLSISISPRRAANRQSQTTKSARPATGFQRIFFRFGFFSRFGTTLVYRAATIRHLWSAVTRHSFRLRAARQCRIDTRDRTRASSPGFDST